MAGIVGPRDGEHYWVANYNFPAAFMDYVKTRPILSDRGSVAGRALLERDIVHIADVLADPEFTFNEAQKEATTERSSQFLSCARGRLSVSSC